MNGSYATHAGFNNSTQIIAGNSVSHWVTLYEGAATTVNYVWNFNGGTCAFAGLRINGKMLADTGVTPDNVPSSASTVRAEPSAGFSIVSYTGTGAAATVAHGLNKSPEFIITKARSNATNWVTGHTAIGWGNYLFLDTTDASGASAAVWNSTAPDSSVFSLASSSYINPNGSGVIAYCFTGVEGYSKFGSYTGNASAALGPFVYLGFRPAMVIVKGTGTTGWYIFDNERDPDNPVHHQLYPHVADLEYSGAPDRMNFLSNGFNIVSGASDPNQAQTWIYAAWAENPFKTSRAR